MAPKPLADFPRPPDDNGRGVHWSASVYHPAGADLQHWIKQLQILQIKWVKLLDDGGGSSREFCRALIDGGIMPVVRLYRERPNPGHLGGRGIDAVRKLVSDGVHYFESNNEPDLPAEWSTPMPAEWLDVVISNFIHDADIILNEGGLPALPAMGPGSKDNALAKVLAQGRGDIFERGGWVAIHNYTLNHPLDYPDDAVNQEGKPLSPEEYAELARWQYSHLSPEEAEQRGVSRMDYDKFQRWAWDGRSLEMVNELRAQAKNPGDTILDDANCFRGYEWFGRTIVDTLGFHVPVISTEGGPVVGWGDDRRYAKMNPTTQAAYQMEINHFLQEEAPEWYFTCCTWLLASRPLGDFNPTWDQMSWYTHAWDLQFGLAGELPLLQLLRDTPSRARWELRGTEEDGSGEGETIPDGDAAWVEGAITGEGGSPLSGVILALHDGEQAAVQTASDEGGRYQLAVAAGQYDLVARWYGPVARALSLDPGERLRFDLADFAAPGQFAISGAVKDTSGAARPGLQVSLQRNGMVHATATSAGDGGFVFAPGLAGEYAVAVEGGAARARVGPDQPQAAVEITLPGEGEKRYHLVEKRLLSRAETGNNRMFFGRVLDAAGQGIKDVALEMRWTNADPGTTFPRTRTGRDPFKPDPDGYYEFLHSPGEFMISVVEGDFPSDVADGLITTGVPGREGDPITYEINFQLRAAAVPVPQQSAVAGVIPGGRVGQMLRLWGGGDCREFVLDAGREFRFQDLAGGLYALELTGVGMIQPDIVLDGQNRVELSFPLLGAIVGAVAEVEQPSIALISETYGFTRHAQLTQEGQYRFTNLPGGYYRLEVGEHMLSGLEGDGQSVLRAPLIQGGEAADEGVLTGLVRDENGLELAGLSVTLWRGGQVLARAATDADGRYTFGDLAPGEYALAVEGVTLAEHLQVDGRRVLVVDLTYAAEPGPPPLKPLAHYYLLDPADPALRPALVRLAAPWLRSQPPGILGFSRSEAAQAAVVTVLGDGVSDADIAGLREGGSQIIEHRQDLLSLATLFAEV